MSAPIRQSGPDAAIVTPRRWSVLGTVGLLFLGGALLAGGCRRADAPAQGPKAVEVIATTPILSKVTDYQDFTGRLDAKQTVDIKARVTGYLTTANFTEGAQVKKDKVLFEIDPRTYQTQLNQYEANIAQFRAREKRLILEERRISSTVKGGASTQQEMEQVTGDLAEARANILASTAQRDQAKVNLGYCTVYAPFDGRISKRYVDPGNSVMADNTVLTRLVSEDPIFAYFDVDERTYLDLKNVSTAQTTWFSGLRFPVLMRLANEEEYRRVGKVDFIDNRVVETSGTVRMRGVFDNPDGVLKPGLFVRVRLPIGLPYTALLIPDEALQSDQGRRYVYVINEKDEVVYRQVKLGQAIQGLRVIKDGVKEGERVIVSGVQRVKQGVQVTVKMQDPPKPPDSPLTRVLTAFLDAPGGNKSAIAEE